MEKAQLCTSELLTNVYLHADGGDPVLRVAIASTRVRISVYDASPELPCLRPPAASEQYGRGLHLVAVLADTWGVTRDLSRQSAKGIWFELATSY